MSANTPTTAATVVDDPTPCEPNKTTSQKGKNLFDFIQEERAKDEGLNKTKEQDPHEPKEIRQETKGLFEDKLDKSRKMGGQARVNREKGESKEGKKLHKSQRKQRNGLKLRKSHALVRCAFTKYEHSHGCHGLMIVERGQTRGTCPKCGRRRWLTDTQILAQGSWKQMSDKRGELKENNGVV